MLQVVTDKPFSRIPITNWLKAYLSEVENYQNISRNGRILPYKSRVFFLPGLRDNVFL